MSFLVIDKITKRYKGNDFLSLDDVSLEVYEGEVLSLLGVNGSGKTTLSSIIATLLRPSSGDVLFRGRSVYEDVGGFRGKLGYCPQKPNLNPLLTVEENLYFDAIYYGVDAAAALKKVEEFLEKFELKKYRKFEVDKLSGGYKQRVMIARALMHDAEIIILDEPTVALDPSVRRSLWDMIKKLKKTVLLTTHYLDEADYLSDRVCVLDKGKIMLIDTPQNLKNKHNDASLENIFIELTKKEEE